jgi:uncharacterized protein (TIGR00297 family)
VSKLKIFSLNAIGLFAALAFAIVIALSTGPLAPSFILLLLVFLVSGGLVTRYGQHRKRELTLYEYERSWENVLANGTVPALCAVLYTVTPAALGAYIGSVAAVTADKFASELGVLGGQPYLLPRLKKVRFGTSGAISLLGTLASWDGGILIGASAYFLFQGLSGWDILVISCIGVAGSMVDTFFGVLENKGLGNKSTTNILCSIAGAIMGYFLLG